MHIALGGDLLGLGLDKKIMQILKTMPNYLTYQNNDHLETISLFKYDYFGSLNLISSGVIQKTKYVFKPHCIETTLLIFCFFLDSKLRKTDLQKKYQIPQLEKSGKNQTLLFHPI